MLTKKLQIILLFMLMLGFTHSLLADEKIKLHLHQPPPNKLGAGELWKLDITNTTNTDIVVYLTGNASEEKDGLIVDGKSKVFTVKPGKSTYGYNDFKDGEVNWKNKTTREAILRTGNVKSGSYNICVTAYYENGSVAGNEQCITQVIENVSTGMITLISPSNGEEINHDAGLTFVWTGTGVKGPYSLKIVELKGSQSPDEAIKENRPILDKDGITGTGYTYGINDPKLEEGKKYVWMIKSGKAESEVYSFEIKKNPGVLIFPSPEDVIVENGMLVFESFESFEKNYEIINSLPDTESSLWEAKIGFRSQRYIFNRIIEAEYSYLLKPYENMSDDELKKIPEPKGHTEIFNKYLNKIIKSETDNTGSETYNYSVDAPYYCSILNENGFFAVGNKIFQVKGSLLKEMDGKDYTRLNIIDAASTDDRINKITVTDIKGGTPPPPTMSACGFPLSSGWQQIGKKRGQTTLYFSKSFINPYPYTKVKVQYYIKVQAQSKNFWGNWVYSGGDCYISGSWKLNFRKIFKVNLAYAGTDTYTKSYSYPYHPNSINNFTTFLCPSTGGSTGTPTSYIYSFSSSSPYAFSDAYLSNVSWSVSVPGGSSGISCGVSCY